MEELMNPEKVKLTGEQRDFVLTSWQQGSFAGGWLGGMSSQDAYIKHNQDSLYISPFTPIDFTQIFIDASDRNVKVHNRLKASVVRMETFAEPKPEQFVEAALTVDITGLTGDKFTPGCSTIKPTIQFDIEELNESVGLGLPESLAKSDHNPDVSQYIKQEAVVGYLDMIEHDVEKLRALESLTILLVSDPANFPKDAKKKLMQTIKELGDGEVEPEQYANAVRLFSSIEKNKYATKGFAEETLEKYLSAQTTTVLNKKELEGIQNGIVSIMSPICSDEERAELKSNAGKIVRACAAEKGQSMSFAQRWERVKDNITDLKNWVTGRENKAQQVMHAHPEIVLKVKKHFTSKTSRATPPIKGSSKGRGLF